MMSGFIDSAIEACLEVRRIVRSDSVGLFHSHERGFGGDVSSGVDLAAESIFFERLSPYGSLFSEESGWMSPRSSVNIILDPIDGSDNFISRFPYYGVSIALEEEGTTTQALVCNLANGDLFIRTPEAYYRSSLDFPALKEEVLSNPFSKIGLFEKSPNHPKLAKKLIDGGLKFRSPGALALSLAYAPYVKYVLFLGTMRSYDIQAGLFLSRHLPTFQNDRFLLIAQDKEVFERLLAIVQKEIF
ncbi:MAG: inositol monophosphatase [Campylobacterales bacterium]|nr:inositol monophosphatase [Campylobacterales bacterium]